MKLLLLSSDETQFNASSVLSITRSDVYPDYKKKRLACMSDYMEEWSLQEVGSNYGFS